MEIERFKKLFSQMEGLPKDFNWGKYEEECERPIPNKIKNGDLESLLFVSWLRAELIKRRR